MIVPLPGGYEAVLREKTTVGQRRAIQKAAFGASGLVSRVKEQAPDEADGDAVIQMVVSPDEADSLFSLGDATILALLESWTLPDPLPTTPEDLLSIDGDVYDALLAASAKLRRTVMGSVDTSYSPDPKVPTSDSGSSGTS
jgi:hypothetical protein